MFNNRLQLVKYMMEIMHIVLINMWMYW